MVSQLCKTYYASYATLSSNLKVIATPDDDEKSESWDPEEGVNLQPRNVRRR